MDARYCPEWYLQSARMQPFSACPAPDLPLPSKLALSCAIVPSRGGIIKASGLGDGLPCLSAANWVCLYNRSRGGADSLASPRSLPSARKLALFFQSPWKVRFIITLFLQSTCSPFRSGRNWLCSARLSLRGGSLKASGLGHGLHARLWQIGFVWHDRLERRLR